MKEFGRHRQFCLLIILFLILKVGGPQNMVEAGEGPDPGEPERFPWTADARGQGRPHF